MKKLLAALILASFVQNTSVLAEDLDTMFNRVKDYVAAKNYAKALEEMQWVEKEIQKMNSGHVQTYFPETVIGFVGGKFESSNALGMTNTERNYTNGGKTIKVSLTGGSAGGAALGGLAALGKMAAMYGGEAGTESLRISGRTAQLNSENGELTIFLDSGSMLKIESSTVEAAQLKTFAESLQIEALDNYLRGISK